MSLTGNLRQFWCKINGILQSQFISQSLKHSDRRKHPNLKRIVTKSIKDIWNLFLLNFIVQCTVEFHFNIVHFIVLNTIFQKNSMKIPFSKYFLCLLEILCTQKSLVYKEFKRYIALHKLYKIWHPPSPSLICAILCSDPAPNN